MSDKIQVVRVEITSDTARRAGDCWVTAIDGFEAVEFQVPLTDVIELTEEQSSFPGGNSQSCRWVSRREAVDD